MEAIMYGDLICLGEAMVELNQQKEGHYIEGIGGDTSNCAVAAARAGANVGVIGALGHDSFGQKICDLWENENIAYSHIKREPNHPTGLYLIHHDSHGHHFSYYRKNSAASHYDASQLPHDVIKKAKILHISGISLAISQTACDTVYEAIKIAKENNVKISFDTNYRPALWPIGRAQAIINHVAAMADYLLPSYDDALLLTGLKDKADICDFYHNRGAKNIALTLGSKGVYLSEEGKAETIAPQKVTLTDATGAGDTFDGNFLARILLDDNILNAAKYANIAASLSVQKYGAIASMPYKTQVEEILNAS